MITIAFNSSIRSQHRHRQCRNPHVSIISITVINVIPSPQDLRAKMESWQHAAESIEEERQSFKDKETAFTMKINDLEAELRDARRKSKADRWAAKVSTTWEIQKLIEKQMLSQKNVYKDTLRFCPGQRGVEGVMLCGEFEIWDVGWL